MEHELHGKDDITLKDLISTIREYFFEFLKNWILVILGMVLFGCLFYFNEFRKPKKYKADLTFTLIENESSRMTGNSVFDLIGFPLGSNTNVNKIMETVKSNMFLKYYLFHKMDYNGKDDFIANHLISVEEVNSGRYFENHIDSVESIEDNELIKSLIYDHLFSKKGPALISSFNEENEIISISFSSNQAEFAVKFCNMFFDVLSQYFLDNMIEKQLETIEIIKNRKDSFHLVLNSKEYQLANYYDKNRKLFINKDKLPELRLDREIQMYRVAYSQSAQNYEIALFNFENSQPIVSIVDRPFLPLFIESKIVIQTVKGLLFGFFIAGVFIVFRKLIRDALE